MILLCCEQRHHVFPRMILCQLALENSKRSRIQNWVNTGHDVIGGKENLTPKFSYVENDVVSDTTNGAGMNSCCSWMPVPDVSRFLQVSRTKIANNATNCLAEMNVRYRKESAEGSDEGSQKKS